jgi:hypothetical protein
MRTDAIKVRIFRTMNYAARGKMAERHRLPLTAVVAVRGQVSANLQRSLPVKARAVFRECDSLDERKLSPNTFSL